MIRLTVGTVSAQKFAIVASPSDTVESPQATSLAIYDFERGQTNEEEEKQGGWISKDKEMR